MSLTEKSILAIDCGSLITKALLIDIVDGTYRFIARGSSISVQGNVNESIAEALGDIFTNTGRELRSSRGILVPETETGDGVDQVVVVTSSGRPLRVAVVAVTEQYSLAAARTVARSIKAEIVFSTSLEGIRSGGGERRKAEAIVESKPDVILVAGGTEGGAQKPLLELAHFLTASKIRSVDGSLMPVVLSVNSEAQQQLLEILIPVFDLQLVQNLLVSETRIDLHAAINLLESRYLTTTLESSPGYGLLAPAGGSYVVPFTQALETVTGFLFRRFSCDVLVVDVGSECTSLYYTRQGAVHRSIGSGVGIGKTAYRFANPSSLERISRWLNYKQEPELITNYLLNKSLRPYTVAQTRDEIDIEHAVLREAIQATFEGEISVGLIVATGGPFSSMASYHHLFLALIDAIVPSGIVRVCADPVGIVPSLGAVAMNDPHAASEIAYFDALADLGTVIAPAGTMANGEIAIKAIVKYKDGSQLEVRVPFGEIEIAPLSNGEIASISLNLAPQLSLGNDRSGKYQCEVHGGAVGVVFDGRGRPLVQNSTDSSPLPPVVLPPEIIAR